MNGEQECEIMLFTNGFLLRDIKLDSLVKNVFAMNALDEAEEFTSEQLCGRFDDIDVDGNGCKFHLAIIFTIELCFRHFSHIFD